ncbi:unnamed protein product, partial [Owenia fusiformis]
MRLGMMDGYIARRLNKKLLLLFMIAAIVLYLQSKTENTGTKIVGPRMSKYYKHANQISSTTESFSPNKTTLLNATLNLQLQFISLSAIYNISLILLDPTIINNSMVSTHNLKEDLINKAIVSYGINRDDLAGTKLETFIRTLSRNKYHTTVVKDRDQNVNHIFLTTSVPSISKWIHIAIIYNRHGRYYWI